MIDYTHANVDYLPAGYKFAHLFRRVYLGTYYPRFLERIIQVKTRAAERGAHYWSEFGYRSMAHQTQLRTAFLTGKGGKAAPAGLSAHQYGLADDSTFDTDAQKPGLQPSWKAEEYAILGEELEAAGLVWGKSFADLPHANYPGFVNGMQLQPLLQRWFSFPVGTPDDVRLREVWKYLDGLADS